MRRKVTIALFVCIFFGAVSAWSESGHLAVVNIAIKDLKAQGLSEVVDAATNLALYGAEYTPNMTKTLEGASLVADELRDFQDIHMYDSWHYSPRQYNPRGLNIKPKPPIRDVISAVNTIKNSFNVMKTGGASRNLTAEKAFIFRMLLHCVGDMHQPLHMGGLYDLQFPDGDMGGTKFNITFLDLPNPLNLTTLHDFWDYGAGKWPRFAQRPITKENMTFVEELADEIMSKFTRESLKTELIDQNVTNWGQAVFDYIPEVVYPNLMKNQQVTQAYQDTVYPVIQKSIALAGYRLSNILRMIFATQAHELSDEDFDIPTIGNSVRRSRMPLPSRSTSEKKETAYQRVYNNILKIRSNRQKNHETKTEVFITL